MYVCMYLYVDSSGKAQLVCVWQVTQPVVDNTGDFLNSLLDEIDRNDSAAVSSSVVSILSVMNPPPSVNTRTAYEPCPCHAN